MLCQTETYGVSSTWLSSAPFLMPEAPGCAQAGVPKPSSIWLTSLGWSARTSSRTTSKEGVYLGPAVHAANSWTSRDRDSTAGRTRASYSTGGVLSRPALGRVPCHSGSPNGGSSWKCAMVRGTPCKPVRHALHTQRQRACSRARRVVAKLHIGQVTQSEISEMCMCSPRCARSQSRCVVGRTLSLASRSGRSPGSHDTVKTRSKTSLGR